MVSSTTFLADGLMVTRSRGVVRTRLAPVAVTTSLPLQDRGSYLIVDLIAPLLASFSEYHKVFASSEYNNIM